jgi:hypothetical protein
MPPAPGAVAIAAIVDSCMVSSFLCFRIRIVLSQGGPKAVTLVVFCGFFFYCTIVAQTGPSKNPFGPFLQAKGVHPSCYVRQISVFNTARIIACF